MSKKTVRHVVIGDVHGCVEELSALLKELVLTDHDRVYFIGDLIDRGPDSAGAVRVARETVERFNGALLLGNHESKFLRFLYNLENNRSALASMKGVDRYHVLKNELDDADIEFLKSGYYTYRIESVRPHLLLHAGIPGNCRIDLDANHAYRDYLPKPPKDLELILMTRYIDEKGNFLSLGSDQENQRYWADAYDGRWGYVVFGHDYSLSLPPRQFPNALNIDTGCAYGGWLTAYILGGDGFSYVTHSVKSKQIPKQE